MSIVIQKILEETSDGVIAIVQHNGHEFSAEINGTRESIELIIGQGVLVEMDYKAVVEWALLDKYSDEDSCIIRDNKHSDRILIKGRIHNIIQLESGGYIIDLYLKNGPEFITISSEELNSFSPAIGAALEIHVHGLKFYPTNT